MNKTIREVGFLALGVGALFEAFVYYDGTWLTGVVLAIGVYFATDALAWGHLDERCRVPRSPAYRDARAPNAAERDFEALSKIKGLFWYIDFTGMILGTIALGFAVQALKLSQHEHHSGRPHGAEPTPELAHAESLAAWSLGAYFVLAVIYWIILARRFGLASDLWKEMRAVWGPSLAKMAPWLLGVAGVICIVMGYCTSESWWQLTALCLLLVLDVSYFLTVWPNINP